MATLLQGADEFCLLTFAAQIYSYTSVGLRVAQETLQWHSIVYFWYPEHKLIYVPNLSNELMMPL